MIPKDNMDDASEVRGVFRVWFVLYLSYKLFETYYRTDCISNIRKLFVIQLTIIRYKT